MVLDAGFVSGHEFRNPESALDHLVPLENFITDIQDPM